MFKISPPPAGRSQKNYNIKWAKLLTSTEIFCQESRAVRNRNLPAVFKANCTEMQVSRVFYSITNCWRCLINSCTCLTDNILILPGRKKYFIVVRKDCFQNKISQSYRNARPILSKTQQPKKKMWTYVISSTQCQPRRDQWGQSCFTGLHNW